MILMIDTKISNLRSVFNAFKRIGLDVVTGATPEDVENASVLILPGVGAFEKGMAALRETGLIDVIRNRVVDEGVPILGICLGMQLLTDTSKEHGTHAGLGLIPGTIEALVPTEPEFRVPNIGWCDTVPTKKGCMFPNEDDVQSFYYVHSYFMKPENPKDIAATISYSGQDITVAVERGNVFGVQFHPEKSQDAGLDLLDNIVRYLFEKDFLS